MRKYLLTSVALLGLAIAGTAQAANFAPTDAFQNAGSSGAPKNTPEPGKIIVRLSGLMAVDLGVVGSTADKSHVTNAKNQEFGMAGFFRLYFGVDGRMTNGIIYGANAEMRTNFAGSNPAGYPASTGIANSSANSSASTWYTRRAYAYIGADQVGILRLGQGDGPLSLLSGNSMGEFYDTGNWDGNACDLVSQGCVAWFFPDVGNEYASNKLAYISPKFAGFSFGASFAPSSAALSAAGSGTAIAGGNSSQQTSSLASDVQRPRNIFEIAGRYQGSVGPVGVDGMLGYSGSDVVGGTTGVFPASIGGGAVSKYYGLSVFDAGLTLSYAGFQAFGHITTGKMNGAFTPQAKLVSGRKQDGLAWTAGVAYGQGPWIVGAGYVQNESQGANGPVGTGPATVGNRREVGVSVGGTYTLTPGVDLFLEYLYGMRHQNGVNFRDGAAGIATADNQITTNMLLGTVFIRW